MTRTERAVARDRSRRQATRGAIDIKNVDQALYREDLGFNVTNAGYKGYKADEAAFQKGYGEATEKLNTFDKQLAAQKKAISSAYGELDALDPSLAGAWDKYSRGFVKVTAVDGNKLGGSWYLPREVVDKLDKEAFTGGKKSYYGTYVSPDQYNVDIRVHGGNFGAQLEQSLNNAASDVKSSFYEQNAKPSAKLSSQIADQRKALDKASGSIQSQRDIVAGERSALQDAANMRQEQRDEAKGAFEKSKAHRQALFSVGDK